MAATSGPLTTAGNLGAIPSIRGYLFQFAKVIELLLEPGAADRAVCVETIDDIAVFTGDGSPDVYQIKHRTDRFSLAAKTTLRMLEAWLAEDSQARFVFVSTQQLATAASAPADLHDADGVRVWLSDRVRGEEFERLRLVLGNESAFREFWCRIQWNLNQLNLDETMAGLRAAAEAAFGKDGEDRILPWLAAVALSAAKPEPGSRRWTLDQLVAVDKSADDTRRALVRLAALQELSDQGLRTASLAAYGREREALLKATQLCESPFASASPRAFQGVAAAVYAAHRSFPLGITDDWTVADAAFSTDGSRIFTVDFNKYRPRVSIWDARSRCLIARLPGHANASVHEVVVAPNGTVFATAGDDGTAILWDARTGEQLHVLNHSRFVRGLAFSADGSTLLTRIPKALFLWDVASGACRATLGEDVVAARLSPCGEIASLHASGASSTLQFRELHGDATAVSFVHPATPRGLACSPDGMLLVTWASDTEARLWHRTNGFVRGLRHSGRLTHAVFSPDGSRLVVCSGDGSARLWEVADGELVTVLHGHVGCVSMASYSTDGAHIVTASEDGDARVWHAQTGFPIGRLDGHKNAVYVARFSPNGRQIVTASEDGDARIWALPGTGLVNLPPHARGVDCCVPAPDGRRVLTADGNVKGRAS